MSTTTTVNFNLKTAGYANFANQTLTFRLLTAGADGSGDYVVLPGIVTATSDANGDGSVTLFRNGVSDIESIYEVILPNREKVQFVIPSGTATVELSSLIVNNQPTGATTQQSSVYAAAIQRANHTGTQPLSTISDASTVQLKPTEGAFANGDKTKLDGIEAGATADQTNAEIRAAVEAATDSNVFTDADHSKLNGIEAGATADQTNEEIQDIVGGMLTGNTETGITVTYQDSDGTIDFVVASQTDENFTTADHSKLDGIEASADVTDTANVTAAGALMDSEVDADIKTLSLPASTTISSYGKTLTDDQNADEARATLGSVPVNFVPHSISFTNTSAYLSLADNANLDVGTGHFSLVFYAKLDSSGTEPVLTKLSGTGYRLKFVSGSLILTMQDSGGAADFTLATGLNDNKWHTYVISITRSGTAIAYVDNVAQAGVNVSGTAGTLDNTGEFRIGSDGGSNAADEIALGNYVILIKQPLTSSEAGQVYFDPNGIKLTDDPSLMVDLRRADRTFVDVSTNALAVTTNGTIIYNQERITSLDNATIGATTAAAITGTTITANTKFVGAIDGTVGATTPAAVTGTNVLATTTLGYTTGSGGTVTQSSSKSQTVFLNKATGQITLNGATLAANTNVSFSFTNSTIAANDILVFNHVSGGTIGAYNFNAVAGSGTATVTVRNITGGDLTEAPVISFAVIKAVTS